MDGWMDRSMDGWMGGCRYSRASGSLLRMRLKFFNPDAVVLAKIGTDRAENEPMIIVVNDDSLPHRAGRHSQSTRAGRKET